MDFQCEGNPKTKNKCLNLRRMATIPSNMMNIEHQIQNVYENQQFYNAKKKNSIHHSISLQQQLIQKNDNFLKSTLKQDKENVQNNSQQSIISLEFELIELKKLNNNNKQNTENIQYNIYHIESFNLQNYQYQHFLSKHLISSNQRAKMIDWLIEVSNTYQLSERTLYLSIYIMDQYFLLKDKQIDPNKLHIIGVTCLFIASKFEDIIALRIDYIFRNIVHKKFTTFELNVQQVEILSTIRFDLCEMVLYDIVITSIIQLKIQEQICQNKYQLFNEIIQYLLKITLQDYSLIIQCNDQELAVSIIYIGLKMLQQIETKVQLAEIMEQAKKILKQDDDDRIIVVSSIILKLAQNFNQSNHQLINLKKVHQNLMKKLSEMSLTK